MSTKTICMLIQKNTNTFCLKHFKGKQLQVLFSKIMIDFTIFWLNHMKKGLTSPLTCYAVKVSNQIFIQIIQIRISENKHELLMNYEQKLHFTTHMNDCRWVNRCPTTSAIKKTKKCSVFTHLHRRQMTPSPKQEIPSILQLI